MAKVKCHICKTEIEYDKRIADTGEILLRGICVTINNKKKVICETCYNKYKLNKKKRKMKEISDELYYKLEYLGIINEEDQNFRNFNVGTSNYHEHIIQPWTIQLDWNLNSFDADIIKRTLRTKVGNPRELDYKKIIHICKERLRQLKVQVKQDLDNIDFEDVN